LTSSKTSYNHSHKEKQMSSTLPITHPGASTVLHNIINSIETTANELKYYEVDQKQREQVREALQEYMRLKPADDMRCRIALGFFRALAEPFVP